MSLVAELLVTDPNGELHRLGRFIIRNDGTHPERPNFGNYEVTPPDGRPMMRITDFDREEGAWALLSQALAAWLRTGRDLAGVSIQETDA